MDSELIIDGDLLADGDLATDGDSDKSRGEPRDGDDVR
jgi:hypothetical protein